MSVFNVVLGRQAHHICSIRSQMNGHEDNNGLTLFDLRKPQSFLSLPRVGRLYPCSQKTARWLCCSDPKLFLRSSNLNRRGHKFVEVMDLKAIQEWTPCEAAEFKSLFAELRNEKSCDRMEVLEKRFPAKTIHQLREKYAEVFADMLYGEIDDEPSRDDITSDLRDWYKLLEGDTHDSVLGPSVETSLFQPSKAAGDQEEIQKSHCKSSRKERQTWTAEEHRQFLYGVQHFGRGEWKSMSKYFVPSRTPTQLASHAQKHFGRIKKNEVDDRRQRHTIKDVRLVNRDMNNTSHSHTEPGKGKPNASSIPLPVLTEDMDILHDLTQRVPNFGQASNSPSNLAGHTTHCNHTIESFFQWQGPGTPSFKAGQNIGPGLAARDVLLQPPNVGARITEEHSLLSSLPKSHKKFCNLHKEVTAEPSYHVRWCPSKGAI